MNTDAVRARLREHVKELQRLVWTWDLLDLRMAGVEPPEDEYDCLVGPLTGLLERGAADDEISRYLEHEMSQHFGHHPGPDRIASCVVELRAWFERTTS
jgi:hypothetical protein